MATDLTLDITDGLHCASCVRRLEKALAPLPGVEGVRVDLATRRVVVGLAGATPASVVSALGAAGFVSAPVGTTVSAAPWWPVGLAALLAVASLVLPHHLALIPAAVAAFGPGWPVWRGAWTALRQGGATMDSLIALGTAAALLSGEAHAAGVTIALTLLGRAIESRARAATASAVERLAAHRPDTVVRVTAGGDETVALAAVAVGDRLRLRPGDTVPVDGRLAEGEVSVDASLLTGESLPQPCAVGEALTGGTRIADGSGVLVAEHLGSDTVLARLVELVRAAAAAKPTVQLLVDRIAAVFVPAVVLIALATWAAWWWSCGDPWRGVMPAAAVLVVACPCALGLATPTALVAAVGRCARAGIFVLTPRALEAAAAIDVVACDKTGTLTSGALEVEDVLLAPGATREQVLAAAAAAEQGSEHPLALAIRCAHLAEAIAPSRGIVQDVRRFTHRAGAGVEAEVDGARTVVGSAAWLTSLGLVPLVIEDGETRTAVHVAVSGAVLGCILLRDEDRPEAPAAIAALHAQGHRVIMLTGDRQGPARLTAERLGLTEAISQCSPAGKLEQVHALRSQGARVAMVGDGINDAPVLAGADLGIAMGGASDVARASADVVLAGGDLRAVPRLFAIARACRGTIRANLVLASAYNVVALPLAAFGHIDPGIAAGAMACSSLLVVGNALRLARG